MEKERSAKEDTSAMAKLVAKIIDNFQLRISNVHIRFEDHSYVVNQFEFGNNTFSSLALALDIPSLQASSWKSCVCILPVRITITMVVC